MSDPHGWNAQNAQIRANQQAAAARDQRFINEGMAYNASRTQPVYRSTGRYGALAYSPSLNRFGWSFEQLSDTNAAYAARVFADASRAPDLELLIQTESGYMMVCVDDDHTYTYGHGVSQILLKRRLFKQLAKRPKVLLAVSAQRGLIVNNLPGPRLWAWASALGREPSSFQTVMNARAKNAEIEARLNVLLDHVREDDAARQEFLDLLETLGMDDPRTNKFRRALAMRLH